jgi:hypothetical protein
MGMDGTDLYFDGNAAVFFDADSYFRDDYWDDDRTCYGQANDRVLTGDRRAEFLDRCLARDDDGDYSRH